MELRHYSQDANCADIPEIPEYSLPYSEEPFIGPYSQPQ
jgi:hypothetical protein